MDMDDRRLTPAEAIDLLKKHCPPTITGDCDSWPMFAALTIGRVDTEPCVWEEYVWEKGKTQYVSKRHHKAYWDVDWPEEKPGECCHICGRPVEVKTDE